MLLTRLYLRNFRVYEDELDLELPPGWSASSGPNGSGKSTLLEAILWTLWGKARTTKEQIRSAGVGGDCITEVEFEHEGHLYLVRRTLSGINSTPRLEAHCDGLVMSEGVRDAERYVESVLGMDDGAFRASVFAEQKQLAAFSDHSPAERLRLVLRLLGITPLDGGPRHRPPRRPPAPCPTTIGSAACWPTSTHSRVEAADAEARAAAASVAADTEQRAAAVAQEMLDAAATERQVLDRRRQEHEALVIEGRGARARARFGQPVGRRGAGRARCPPDRRRSAGEAPTGGGRARPGRARAGSADRRGDRGDRRRGCSPGGGQRRTSSRRRGGRRGRPRRGGGGRASPGGVAGLGPGRRRRAWSGPERQPTGRRPSAVRPTAPCAVSPWATPSSRCRPTARRSWLPPRTR